MQVIVGESAAEQVRERIAAKGLPVELLVIGPDGHASADLSQASAFFRLDMSRAIYERILEAAPQLRWVHTGSAGVDGLINQTLRERTITLTNSAGAYGIPIAEWVLHALLMIVKRAPQQLAAQQERRWQDSIGFDELTGKTLTILGAGGIGREIARRAAAFDMRIWGVNRSGRDVPHVERIVSGEQWRDLLPETDMLVLAAPLTESTRNLIGARELALLPERAWLINIARGTIVDEAALIEALRTGAIAGAALDTFVKEPLPPDSPLWTLPNVIISPHHSGSSPRSQERVVDLFMENLERFVNGAELRNIVDFETGY